MMADIRCYVKILMLPEDIVAPLRYVISAVDDYYYDDMICHIIT